jgi:hypothetical protein
LAFEFLSLDSCSFLRKTVSSSMNSERQKREEEIARLMRGVGLNKESDVAFQEEIKKAASAIVEEQASRIQKTERIERRKQPMSPAIAGAWLIVLGVGVALFAPTMGAAIMVCGIAVIVWAKFRKSPKE